MPENKTASRISPGGRLRAALTDEQIEKLLDVAVEAGHLKTIDERLRSVDSDLADTVQRVLGAPRIQSEAAASSRKTLEIWNGLWAAWIGHVEEVGDEKGPYANHKEHWHPPYFDHGALARDLEETAGPLSEWIDRAFPLVEQPDLFLDSLAEIDRNVRSLPDWFQTVEDNFVLGPRASTCVLRWTWLALAGQPKSGPRLVDRLCGLEVPSQHSELDRDACCQFLAGLPEDVCREIHTHLQEPQFAEKLANLRSVWHRIQHEFEGRFDRAAHLRTCEEHLERNWHYGEPLIADAVSRQDFRAAEEFVARTLSSLLGWSEEEPWCPENLLLPESCYYRPPEESHAKLDLLDQWENAAARLEKPERVANLRLQRTILQSPENWTVVLDAFEEYKRHLSNPAAAERLFAEWQQRIAKACTQHEPGNKVLTDNWTHRLIEAQRDPPASQELFLKHVELWLECCSEHATFFHKNWRSLALLTRYLPQYPEVQAACPTFHSHVLFPALQISGEMEKSLRNALVLLGAGANRIKVRPVWETHLHTLVPVPGGSGSSYRESALWMKALSEVNPNAYASLLNRWKSEFRRRRNLWADMAATRCPAL
jgi:hypothetical protein